MRRGPWKKMLVMTEGLMGRYDSKAAAGVVRYCRDEVVGLLDSQHAGEDIEGVLGCGAGLPVVADVASAMPLGPGCLVIGVAPVGGAMAGGWRKHLVDALEAGLDLVAGLHQFLNHDEELAAIAKRTGATIYDIRRPRSDIPIGNNLAAKLRGKRILTVGTDGNIGKMHTSLELTHELERRGRDADFVATGQIGIMISGRGVPIDHVVADFVSGAIEQELMLREEHEVYLVEGQGAIIHPGFSAVTLGLLHGTAPDAMIFCHNPTRKAQRYGVEIPPLDVAMRLHEDLCRYIHPSKVIAVSLNCAELTEDEARDAVNRVQDETGLPATDPVMFGAGPLAEAVEGML
jgi:D-glutamate N-acetyltransferase